MKVLTAAAAIRPAEPRRSTALLEEILAEFGGSDSFYAVVNGTPGPWTKSIALVMDKQYQPVAVIKIGITKAAGKLICNEAAWLSRLAEYPKLASRVPQCIGCSASGSAVWLAEEPLYGRSCPKAFGQEQIAFLRLLQSELPATRGFQGSGMQQQMHNCLESVQSVVSAEWRERAAQTLETIQSLLPDDIPMTAAHRDFAYWNISADSFGIQVFDWEYARAGYLPLHDAFHFLLMPKVLQAPLAARQIAETIRIISQHRLAEKKQPAVAAQCLAYLLDICLMYIEANEGRTTDRVVERYADMIDKFSLWRGKSPSEIGR